MEGNGEFDFEGIYEAFCKIIQGFWTFLKNFEEIVRGNRFQNFHQSEITKKIRF